MVVSVSVATFSCIHPFTPGLQIFTLCLQRARFGESSLVPAFLELTFHWRGQHKLDRTQRRTDSDGSCGMPLQRPAGDRKQEERPHSSETEASLEWYGLCLGSQ